MKSITFDQGLDAFTTDHALETIKPKGQSYPKYTEWLETFTFFQEDAVTVALRVNGKALEIHWVTEQGINPKALIRSLKAILSHLTVPLITFISEDLPKVRRLAKRLGFEVTEEDKLIRLVE